MLDYLNKYFIFVLPLALLNSKGAVPPKVVNWPLNFFVEKEKKKKKPKIQEASTNNK